MKTKGSNLSHWIIFFLLCVLLIALITFAFLQTTAKSLQLDRLNQPSQQKTQKNAPNKGQKPLQETTPKTHPIPSGDQQFSVSSPSDAVIQFKSGLISPYDPKMNSEQKFTLSVRSKLPDVIVTMILDTDHKKTPLTMQKIKTDGDSTEWQGSWVVTDTYLLTYDLHIQATANTATQKIDITLR